MAKGVTRIIRLILDRKDAKKAADDLIASLGTAGEKGGLNFYRELKQQFDRRMGELREQLARGIIDQQEFRKQSEQAAKQFNQSLLKSMDEARKKGELTDREYIKLTKTLKNVGKEGGAAGGSLLKTFGKLAGIVGGAFALHRIQAFGRSLFTTAAEADAVWNRLNGQLENAGVNFSDVADEIERTARAMQDVTTVGDEDFAEVLQELLSISNDYAASLQNVQLVADLAAAKQIDLKTAAQLVGKVMVGEVSTLKRYGIVVEEGADALEVMRERFKGMAENEAKTFAGQMKQLNNEWGDFKEALGRALATGVNGSSVLDTLTAKVKDMATWVETNSGKIQEMGQRLFEAAGRAAELFRIAATPLTFTIKALFDPKGWWDNLINDRRHREKFEPGLQDNSASSFEAFLDRLNKGQVRNAAGGVVTPPGSPPKPPPRPPAGGSGKTKAAGPFLPEWLPTGEGELQPVDGMQPVLFDPALNEAAAQEFVSPWEEALGVLSAEVTAQGGLFEELGMAWAEGGLKGLAQLASSKVKQNIAEMVENAARAFGAFALGDARAGGLFLKSAAEHGAAAAAWKLVGGAGGGGSSRPAGGASLGGSRDTVSKSAADTEPKQVINVYVDGFDSKKPNHVRILDDGLKEVARTNSSVNIFSRSGSR